MKKNTSLFPLCKLKTKRKKKTCGANPPKTNQPNPNLHNNISKLSTAPWPPLQHRPTAASRELPGLADPTDGMYVCRVTRVGGRGAFPRGPLRREPCGQGCEARSLRVSAWRWGQTRGVYFTPGSGGEIPKEKLKMRVFNVFFRS